MKKIENNFTVTGFLGKDAEIREFTNSSVARFPLAVSRQERNAEETNRISAFMNIETWRKNENTGSFDQLTKGTMLTIEGYFRPEESDRQGWCEAQSCCYGGCQVLSSYRKGGCS